MATPPPISSTHHRKIELTTASDLTHLTTLARAASTTRLDTAFPPPPSDAAAPDAPPDELRARVAHLLDAFVARTFTGVRANACVAGADLPAGNGEEDEDGADGECNPYPFSLSLLPGARFFSPLCYLRPKTREGKDVGGG
jgi:hypothetical protein